MRHDAHYVEELAGQTQAPVGRFIPIDLLDPNPEQPRMEIGDLEDLTASIRDKGVLEPLLVKPSGLAPGRWMIIAGERRWRAARAAGLRDVPCIEMDVDESTVAEIALVENMQRKDLTAWEEADGLAALCNRFGYTHEEAAKRVGKSRSTVTEALSINGLPADVRERCRQADIQTKSILLQVVRQPDIASMHKLVDEITQKGLKRDEARAARKAQLTPEGYAPPKPSLFRYELADQGVRVEVRFERDQVEAFEVREALQVLLDDLTAAAYESNNAEGYE
jgi:ParB family chromosome partitioning protein